MKVIIKEKEIELKSGFRAQMIYERINGETFTPKGLNEIILFFYCTILGSDKDLVLTFDEYIDYLDSNPTVIAEFTKYLTELFQVEKYLNQNEEIVEGDTKKKE